MDDLVGQQCSSLRRWRHRMPGHAPSETGPVEFGWETGAWLTLYAAADWTLRISYVPWVDPFADVAGSERDLLVEEVGLWEEAPLDGASESLLGRALTSALPRFSEVGELAGLTLSFGRIVAEAEVNAGELEFHVQDGV